MRLIELEIHNIRGICDLHFEPKGKNIVVWGSNGSGKSAVVDAIDFLLTGRISRLTGKGTGDVKLEIHGTHIDHKATEASVRAIISIPLYKNPIEIKRCIATPGILEYKNPADRAYLTPILAIASRGQYVLTRREILKYVAAEPGDRAEGIESVLDIKEIGEIRKTLVKVENTCEKELSGSEKVLATAIGEINALVGEKAKTFNSATLLKYVNEKRKILLASSLEKLTSANIKTDIIPPVSVPTEKAVNSIQAKKDIDALVEFQKDENLNQLLKIDQELRDSIRSINADPSLSRSLKKLQLIQIGITLLDASGTCPLCDTTWPPGQLQQHLNQHLVKAQTALGYQTNITNRTQNLLVSISTTISRIKSTKLTAELVGLSTDATALQTWVNNLEQISKYLANPVENYETVNSTADLFRQALSIPDSIAVFERIQGAIEAQFPKTTPQLDAWDTLTKLDTRIGSYEKAMDEFGQKLLIYKRAENLHDNFILARDAILNQLYDSVRDRFVYLYRQIHSSDEAKFTAIIRPDQAGVDFKVAFYERGEHPPQALHSEGHQDSMGLCLYLALAEKLAKGIIDLIILDDVVMSVDTDHRRHVCDLLSKAFPDNQFLITTHDRTWANQLRIANVVDANGMLHFYNWHVATGPQVDTGSDVWGRIGQDLLKDDVSSAAGKLRQHSEQFFATVCDALQAPVIFKMNGTYDLGNLLNGAIGQYFNLIKKAKLAAQSWGKDEEFNRLQEFENIGKTIYSRTNAENWSVNPAIHYTNWENFSKLDFQPVMEAFRDLYGIFSCSKCGGILHTVTVGMRQEAVKCDCGQVNWNLFAKGK